jgi:hypothetical protein
MRIQQLRNNIIDRVTSKLWFFAYSKVKKSQKEYIYASCKEASFLIFLFAFFVQGFSLTSILIKSGVFIITSIFSFIYFYHKKIDYKKILSTEENKFANFSSDNLNAEKNLRLEFFSGLRFETVFSKAEIELILEKNILDLTYEEMNIFSELSFNDNQIIYMKDLLKTNNKINVLDIERIMNLTASKQHERYIKLGGSNKKLEHIFIPEKYA